MVTITFLGTGDAFDPYRGNSSYLIEHDGFTILFDCGFTAPQALLRLLDARGLGPEALRELPDAIVLSHVHGDHMGGLARLLMPAWIAGRTKPLAIYGPLRPVDEDGRHYPALRETAETAWRSLYPGNHAKVQDVIPISWHELSSAGTIGPFTVTTAPTVHAVFNLAARFDLNGLSLGFSGDGELTDASRELFEGCGLLVHEAFMPEENVAGHGNARDVIAFAEEHGVKDLRLVHLDWQTRRDRGFDTVVAAAQENGVNVRIAEDGDVVEF